MSKELIAEIELMKLQPTTLPQFISHEARVSWNTAIDSVLALILKHEGEVDAWQDKRDEYSDAIDAAHPSLTGDHKTYGAALELIGNRHSKWALVDLVNWLLVSPSIGADRVKVPRSEREAKVMKLVAERWLDDHEAEKLRTNQQPREDAVLNERFVELPKAMIDIMPPTTQPNED